MTLGVTSGSFSNLQAKNGGSETGSTGTCVELHRLKVMGREPEPRAGDRRRCKASARPLAPPGTRKDDSPGPQPQCSLLCKLRTVTYPLSTS